MALIEGVDDEVTLLIAVILLLAVIVLAWVSTHTSERSHPGDVQNRADRVVCEQGAEREATGSSCHAPSPNSDATLCTNRVSPVSETPLLSPPEDPPVTGEPALCTPNSTSHDNEPPTLRHRGPQTESPPSEDQETITLRLKFLNDTERAVTVRLSDTVLNIKRSQFPEQESRVRLIYQGQLLRDDSQSVASLQLTDGCVLHCHISPHASPSGRSGAELDQVPLNIGSLLVPLLGLVLFILWYCQLQYPNLFTATATACLGLITLLVTVMALSSYRR
ncbi:transmembrane and ubiquitin-like domain-containing protein 1 [Pseudophryne corroboree]|uniref:transmembrane and ubiquitin-like domain-containing protein 1 n=1 Tax=Pseudophryne corroboree TaxID=495146 RepID=UPI003081FF83